MTIQIELSAEAEARLTAEAVMRGVAREAYAGLLLQQALEFHSRGTGVLTPDEVRAATEALTINSVDLPVLPPEATERSSYYEERR
jgi:uncharacterized membrane protein (DUF4010 family)